MGTSRERFFEIVQTLGAYLAVPAVLLYPVGFLALFLQFVEYFHMEFYTAWYAASLADRMVVIGLGATILVAALIGSVLLSWKVSQILCLHSDRCRKEGVADPGPFGRKAMRATRVALWSLPALILYVAYSRILSAGRVSCLAIFGRDFREEQAEAVRHQLDLWPDSLIPAFIFVIGGIWGGRRIHSSYQRWRESEYDREGRYPPADYRLMPFLGKGVAQGWIMPGLVAAYGFSVFASLCLAWYTPAFMPFMHYNPEIATTERGDVSDDRYLSQVAGRWHVIHRYYVEVQDERENRPIPPPDGKRTERRYSVLALSDEEARYAGVVPLSAMNPRVAPLPWLEDADEQVCGAPPAPPRQ